MPKYHYVGRNTRGEEQQGVLSAQSQEGVAEQLLEQGIVPIKIVQQKKKISYKGALQHDLFSGNKVKLDDLVNFCRQMYSLVRAGVPIIQSLSHIINSTRSPVLARVLPHVSDDIAGGMTFASALAKHPKVFSSIFVNIIGAGENSGALEESFEQLIQHLELEIKTKKRIKSATRYPMIVIVALIIALCVVNFMVVPAFADMFKTFRSTLPLPTRIMIGMSHFMVTNWLWILLGVIIIIIGLRYYVKTPAGRFVWDSLKLKVPIFGPIVHRIVLARFARTFSIVIRTGVPLIKGLNLVADTVGNVYVSKYILVMRDSVEAGDTLTQSAMNSKMFSPMVIQMLSVGEESGQVEQLLEEVALYYEREVDYDLERLGDLIEPILLILMGILVLFLALGVFLPMWDMVSFVRK